jgi:hypothetical protein
MYLAYGEIENLRTQSIFFLNLPNKLFIGINISIMWHKSTYTRSWQQITLWESNAMASNNAKFPQMQLDGSHYFCKHE